MMWKRLRAARRARRRRIPKERMGRSHSGLSYVAAVEAYCRKVERRMREIADAGAAPKRILSIMHDPGRVNLSVQHGCDRWDDVHVALCDMRTGEVKEETIVARIERRTGDVWAVDPKDGTAERTGNIYGEIQWD